MRIRKKPSTAITKAQTLMTSAVKKSAIPPATRMRMMKTTSRMKAAARDPRSASSTISGTPSGVTMARWRRPRGKAAVSEIVVISRAGRNRLQEIEGPEQEHEPADRVARPKRHHQLPCIALQQACDHEHQHAAECHLPGCAPGLG